MIQTQFLNSLDDMYNSINSEASDPCIACCLWGVAIYNAQTMLVQINIKQGLEK